MLSLHGIAAPLHPSGAGRLCRGSKKSLKEYRHGTDHWRHRRLAHAHHRLCVRQEQARRPRLGTRSSRTSPRVADWLAEKKPDVILIDLQRSRHLVLLRPLFGVHAGRRRRSGTSRTKAVARATCRRSKGIRRWPRTSATSLMTDEFDMSFFQNKALDHGCFSPLSMLCPHKPEWPRQTRAAANGRAAIAGPECATLLQARPGTEARNRKLSGGPQGRDPRDRWPVASGAWRARRLQQHGMGPALSRSLRARPRATRRHDDRRIRGTGRLRRRGSRDVADDARRAVDQRRVQAPQLLPAVDGGHRDRHLRRRRG